MGPKNADEVRKVFFCKKRTVKQLQDLCLFPRMNRINFRSRSTPQRNRWERY